MRPHERLESLGMPGAPSRHQDWGIEQSDPARVTEFLQFAINHEAIDPYEHELLADLVIQSVEDLLADQALTGEQEMLLLTWLNTRDRFPESWSYWRSLGCDDEPCLVSVYLDRASSG